MAKEQPWKAAGLKKDDWIAKEVAKAVGAGKEYEVETVDFSDPNRPPTCLEVDFPIVPINETAQIEGSSGATRKPIYQVGKWWARRNSSVFRSLLLAAATKAPDDPAEAAKAVWDVYYGNHQKNEAFKNLKVADIFMGGGTTIVEGSRLGMQMYGNDLNPVAWFVVKNEMAKVERAEVEKLLEEIEEEVKPQIMPFYACDCPRGHKGKWFEIASGKLMGKDFDPFSVSPEERKKYRYEGPEIIYTFWAKHGPCQVTGCGQRTPIMGSPVMAVKSLSVKYWPHVCPSCSKGYDVEQKEARMSPGSPLVVADTEAPYAILNKFGATCPHCKVHEEQIPQVVSKKPKKKKVELSLLVDPNWLRGDSSCDSEGEVFGGTPDSDVESTLRWNEKRASSCRLVEVRGELPTTVNHPSTGESILTGKDGGTVPKKSSFECGACGAVHDVLESVKSIGTTAPLAAYANHCYCPQCDQDGQPYNGRFFEAVSSVISINSACQEWYSLKETALTEFWPREELPFGFMTHLNNGGIPNHGYTHWWKMFNDRQLYVLTLLLKEICKLEPRYLIYVLGAFQQYLRNQSMFTIWNRQADQLEPQFSNSNFHPKALPVENSVFPKLGRGNWRSCADSLIANLEWRDSPTEILSAQILKHKSPNISDFIKGKSVRVSCKDPLKSESEIDCRSSTDLSQFSDSTFDLVVTDPPFGGLLHYSELSDFFYVWLKIALSDHFPGIFSNPSSPKALEAVANKARNPGRDEGEENSNADIFYQRTLTSCWKEAFRILKPAGTLVFTFHHSEDEPWIAVLESLFDSGFYLEATFPLRSDETKGEGAKPGTFGSQTIEYDIVHVCRKRTVEPQPISWAKMRRQVLNDVRGLKDLLEHHSKEGLPEADLQVIRRGKALEYFSRHYGKVYKSEGEPISVQEALVGINQLLYEEAGATVSPPPPNAEPFTQLFLRLFDGKAELPRDQMQKFLQSSGTAPSDFINRGWCYEKKKVYYLTSPQEIAERWLGKHRKGMTSDYDQAAFFLGACEEGSGINASETLNNANFKPHPALKALLTWFRTRGASPEIRNAAAVACELYKSYEAKQRSAEDRQVQMFFSAEGGA